MAKYTVFKPTGTTSKQITPFPEIKVTFPKTFITPQVTKSGGGSATLYTVPAGRIFVLFSAYISQVATNATAGGECKLRTSDPNCATILCNVTDNPPAGQVRIENLTQQYGEGIRFAAGTVFTLYTGSSQDAQCGMCGYLVDNNAESLFYLTA